MALKRLWNWIGADRSFKKMWKTARKAIEEHRKAGKAYAPLRKALPSLRQLKNRIKKPTCVLQVESRFYAECGRRPQMEDAHFIKRMDAGGIAGVFDGHGGAEVALYAKKRFEELWTCVPAKNGVYRAFVEVIEKIHGEVLQNRRWDHMGAAAVIVFWDQDTHLVYTATLGDSEANIYRDFGKGNMFSIPLSCVRNWGHKKEAQRASLAMHNPQIAKEWPKVKNPKVLRLEGIWTSLNLSRAIGDKHLCGTKQCPGVIQDPKVTVNLLQKGDLLMLCCDGIKDYVPEEQIVQFIREHRHDPLLAQKLVQYAIYDKRSQDNATVVMLDFS